MWNKLTTTTTSEHQEQIQQEEETSGESDSQCFMVQGNDSLEFVCSGSEPWIEVEPSVEDQAFLAEQVG